MIPNIFISLVILFLLYYFWINKPKKPSIINTIKSTSTVANGWLISVVILQGCWMFLSWRSSLMYYSDKEMNSYFTVVPLVMYVELILICIGLFLVSCSFYLLITVNIKFKSIFIVQFFYSIIQTPLTLITISFLAGSELKTEEFLRYVTGEELVMRLTNIIYGTFILVFLLRSKRIQRIFN